jgi:hypothetical protein
VLAQPADTAAATRATATRRRTIVVMTITSRRA